MHFRKEQSGLRSVRKVIIKIALILTCLISTFLLTGLMYFRYDVTITDGGMRTTVYTMQADPYEILDENEIMLGAYDRIRFTGADSAVAKLDVIRAYEVPVTADGEEIATVYNIDSTVGELLDEFAIDVGEFDIVSPAREESVKKGDKISITKAFEVKITADGETKSVSCNNNTAAELLARADIKVDSDDKVSVKLDKKITSPCEIKVTRVEKKVRTVKEIVPYETSTVKDNLSAIGTVTVGVKGVDGVTETTVTETYIDGVKTDSVSKTKVISEKVDEVIYEGAAVTTPYCQIDDPAIVLENGRPVNYEYIISGPATAYTAYDGAKTASGLPAEIGTVAVNPNVIPYGSLLYIVGQNNDVCYGYAIAADTGNGMMDGTIPVDVYMGNETHYSDACAWGYRLVDIYVIRAGY